MHIQSEIISIEKEEGPQENHYLVLKMLFCLQVFEKMVKNANSFKNAILSSEYLRRC